MIPLLSEVLDFVNLDMVMPSTERGPSPSPVPVHPSLSECFPPPCLLSHPGRFYEFMLERTVKIIYELY